MDKIHFCSLLLFLVQFCSAYIVEQTNDIPQHISDNKESGSEEAQSERRRLMDFSCETDGFHSNPLDCGTFIECFKGDAYEIDCPTGLHYSHDRQICVAPCEAKCAPYYELYCSYENSEPFAQRFPENNILCTKFDYLSGIYQNPKDCSSYIKCKDGKAYTVSCPPGLHYGQDDETCVKPCDAECDPSFAIECGWDKPWYSEKDSQTLEPGGSTTELSMGIHSLAKKYHFNCIHDSVYRHPGDCGLYIVCDHKIPHIMQCPKGFHWSVKDRRCDWPCAARCNSSLACECGWPECKRTEDATELSEPDCQAPPDVGPCKARISKYYYDAENGHCKRFFYGGCAGNSNNFETERECMEKCVPKMPVLIDCEAEPEVGPCEANIPRYYYDRQSGQCKSFHYGGCQGNTNNFLSESECREKCQEKMVEGFECPSNNGIYGHYPDCLSYYHCKRGKPTLKKCPKGTAFDHHKSKCVTEHEATCVYKCAESDATYPLDEDCHKYIDCVNRVSKVEKCPPGKAFDPDQRDCIDERQVSTCHWS